MGAMAPKLNIGCGLTPTPGWVNYDNSLSFLLAKVPWLTSLLSAAGALTSGHLRAIEFARSEKNIVRFVDARKGIPEPDASVAAVYSSHMLEHLDRAEARRFLCEVHRVLVPGGVVRLAVPDLGRLVQLYSQSNDADAFLSQMYMGIEQPRTILQRIRLAMVGFRHHLWMYDEHSLVDLLTACGFAGAARQAAGATRIKDPGHLDLSEREEESLYVEAERSQ